MGYNGRGVGMGSIMGSAMAARVLNRPAEEAFMPMTTPDEFVFHGLHKLGASVFVRWYQLLDAMEAAAA